MNSRGEADTVVSFVWHLGCLLGRSGLEIGIHELGR